jgi:catalase
LTIAHQSALTWIKRWLILAISVSILRGTIMSAVILRPLVILSLLCLAAPPARADDPDPEDLVNSLEKISGVHKGLRRNHAKGSCAVGSFIGSKAASALSASFIFSGKKIPVLARFSVAGPNPGVADASHSPRGMALQFQLANGDLQQMAMLNAPVFVVATPAAFYDLLQLDVPDPATGKKDPARAPAFFGAHPESKPFIDWLMGNNPPPSYAAAPYYSLHAFKFIAKDRSEHWVRWRFEPMDGLKTIASDALAKEPDDFLDKALTERTHKGPVKWEMIVTVGEKDDPIDNPTLVWPAGRKEIKAGVLSLTKGGQSAVGSCEEINFDPNVASAGIEPSPDPILQFRSQAYAVSYTRRESEKQ